MSIAENKVIQKIINATLILGLLAGIIWWLNDLREDTDAFVERGVTVLGKVKSYNESSMDDPARVAYVYLYQGQLYEYERSAHREYKRGDFVYVMLVPNEPEIGYHIFHRKVAASDTIVNITLDHIKLTKLEIRDMLSGKHRIYDNVRN